MYANVKEKNKSVTVCRCMMLYIRNPKVSTQRLLELINSVKLQNMINIQKCFTYTKSYHKDTHNKLSHNKYTHNKLS